jgi:hypothetical protein
VSVARSTRVCSWPGELPHPVPRRGNITAIIVTDARNIVVLLNLLPQLHSLSVSISFGRTPPLWRILHNSRVFDFSRFNRPSRRRDAESHTFRLRRGQLPRYRHSEWHLAERRRTAKINILAAGYQRASRKSAGRPSPPTKRTCGPGSWQNRRTRCRRSAMSPLCFTAGIIVCGSDMVALTLKSNILCQLLI